MISVGGFSIIYIVLSSLSLIMAATAVYIGEGVLKLWKLGDTLQQRYELEKKIYLVVTLMGLGLWLRFFLIPLWFWTLAGLMPLVPGAMCLTSVHMMVSPTSFIATSLKFVIPMVYGYWLVLNHLDQELESQPFIHLKLANLRPIAVLMAFESWMDIRYLLAFAPKPTSCCVSLFDIPHLEHADKLTQYGWFWTAAFYLGVFLLAGLLLRLSDKLESWPRQWKLGVLFWCVGILVSMVLASHYRLSPLLLEAPLHHCVFCLWQKVPLALIFTITTVAGVWLTACYLGIIMLRSYERISFQLAERVRKLRFWGAGLILTGALGLGMEILAKLLNG